MIDRCQGCCCPCCLGGLQQLEVSSPPGSLIGKVEENWSIVGTRLVLKDQVTNTNTTPAGILILIFKMGEPLLRIEAGCCKAGCCSDVEFRVLSVQTGEEVGLITKLWAGLGQEVKPNLPVL